jgi:hypothetical protein
MQGLNLQREEYSVVVLENFGHNLSYTSHIQRVGYNSPPKIECNYIFQKNV